jgi:signal peptidase I
MALKLLNKVSAMTGNLTTRKLFHPKLHPERRRSMILACMLFWSIISFFVVSRYVIQTAEVLGESMEPTLSDGDRYLLQRWFYLFKDPQLGDIVAVETPGDDVTASVKRVIGLPGDRIRVSDGRVYINGLRLAEPYLSPDTQTESRLLGSFTRLVPRDHYFFLGDNRGNSADSRIFGAIHRDAIQGRIAPHPVERPYVVGGKIAGRTTSRSSPAL